MTEALETNGIVLSSMPVGESDRRLSILTKELGRISCFVRGARKPNSPLISVTRPFTAGKFFIYPGRDSYSLQHAEVTEHFESVVMDMEKNAYGSYFLELATRFSHEGYDGGGELNLLFLSLKALSGTAIPSRLVMRIFELRSLVLDGVLPAFTEDDEYTTRFELGKSALYTLSFIRTSDLRTLYTFNVSDEVLAEISRVADYFVEKNIDKPLKAKELLAVLTS